MSQRPDRPYKRTYPDGKVRWVARYTNPVTGEREYARPATFELQRDAQQAINEAIELALRPELRSDTVRSYAATWTERHPRGARTNKTNAHRVGRLLEVELDGKPFGDYQLAEVRKRHVKLLIDYMLRVEKRAITGVRNLLVTHATMWNDAIEDELAEVNPFLKPRLQATDPRIRKRPRKPRIHTYDDMHALAGAARLARRLSNGEVVADRDDLQRECMVRVLSDCGLRLGEMLALRNEDYDGQHLHVRGTANDGLIIEVDGETKLHKRHVPVPPSLADLLARHLEHHSDPRLLFPTMRGNVWRERNFYRDLWYPAQKICGLDIRPHEMRHSYLSTLRAAGVEDADLAATAGHSVETLLNTYTHALGKSDDKIRAVIG